MRVSKWGWAVAAVFVFGIVYFLTQIPLTHTDSMLLVDWLQKCTVGEAAAALFAIVFFATMWAASAASMTK